MNASIQPGPPPDALVNGKGVQRLVPRELFTDDTLPASCELVVCETESEANAAGVRARERGCAADDERHAR